MKTENVTATKNVLAVAGMKAKTNVKAGRIFTNHNQTIARGLRVRSSLKAGFNPQPEPPGLGGSNHNQTVSKGLRVKSNVKAGGFQEQHNQTVVRGMRVKSGMKGGFNPQPEPPGLRIKSNVKAGGIVVPQ